MSDASLDNIAGQVPEVQGQGLEQCTTGALDELCLLQVLRNIKDNAALVQLRLVSRRVRDLADLVLEEEFRARWRISEVVQPPAHAPMLAAARPAAFVLCHALAPRDTLAAVAVRHGTDVVALKRLNNLMSDGALASRSHIYVPVPDAAAAAAGRRVAFVHDTHSKRRFIVIVRDGDGLPPALASSSGAAGPRQAPGSSQQFVVAKLARVLERALRIDSSTAKFYVQQAGCDVRAAIEKYEEDKRWEKVMKPRGPRLNL